MPCLSRQHARPTWEEGDIVVVGDSWRARVALVRTGVCVVKYLGGVDAPEPAPDLCVCLRACEYNMCHLGTRWRLIINKKLQHSRAEGT